MIRSARRFGVAALFIGAAAQVHAVPLSVDFAATVDGSGGRSFDAGCSVAPTAHLTFSAGAGQTGGSDDTAGLRGTLLDAGVSLHGDRAGVALSYDRFDDHSNYLSATLGARLWFTAGDFEIALLGRHRQLGVTLTLALPLRTLTREEDFSALGGGLQLDYTHGNFSAYAMAVTYDYDDDFERFLALTQSPQLARRPRIEALIGSFVTQAQGAIDRQAGAGVEQIFGRHSLGLDLSQVRDAIDGSSSLSVALTWRYTQSAHRDWSLSGGMIDSDRYGDLGFVGVALGLDN